MVEILVSSSNDRDDREIDEYHDDSNRSGSSSIACTTSNL